LGLTAVKDAGDFMKKNSQKVISKSYRWVLVAMCIFLVNTSFKTGCLLRCFFSDARANSKKSLLANFYKDPALMEAIGKEVEAQGHTERFPAEWWKECHDGDNEDPRMVFVIPQFPGVTAGAPACAAWTASACHLKPYFENPRALTNFDVRSSLNY